MTHVPTKFHWDILKNEGILTTTTTTTTPIINETTQKQDIPLLGEYN